jgi:anthranilate phosphoribosyltransferase
MAKLMAESLAGMPHVQRAFVVHGEPGWDEATPAGRFELFVVTPGQVHREQRDPRDYGIARCTPEDLAGGDAAHNARALEEVLVGRDRGPHHDALVLGAGLILELTGRVAGLQEGVKTAEKTISSGDSEKFLRQLRAFSESLA